MITLLVVTVLLVPFVQSLTPPACVDDRSCCSDVSNDVNVLCWVNRTHDWTVNYTVWDHYNYDETERMIYHFRGSNWHISNPNHFNDRKGRGFEIASYGQPIKIPGFSSGTMKSMRWTPFGLLAVVDNSGKWEAEIQVGGDRYYAIYHIAVLCDRFGNCNGTNGVHIEADSITTANLNWDTSIDGYCGWRYNETSSSTSYQPTRTLNYAFIYSECPDWYDPADPDAVTSMLLGLAFVIFNAISIVV